MNDSNRRFYSRKLQSSDAQLSPTAFLKFISTRLFLLLLPPRRLRVLLRPPGVDAPVHQRAFSRGRAAAGKPRVHTEIFRVCLPVPTREITFLTGDHSTRSGAAGTMLGFTLRSPERLANRRGHLKPPPFQPKSAAQLAHLQQHFHAASPGLEPAAEGYRRDEPAETATAFLQNTAKHEDPAQIRYARREETWKSLPQPLHKQDVGVRRPLWNDF